MTGAARDKLIVVLGPTASGKTALAVRLARKLGTDIISGDSMLVYRGFNIGAAKPDEKERGGVRHELIDILSPEDSFSVNDFQRLAGEKIAALHQRGKIPILAGGTGLYVKALLEGYEFNRSPEDKAYRHYLETLAQQRGRAYVHAMLEEIDPAAAARLHVNDFRRIARALEVWKLGEEKISRTRRGSGDRLVYDAWVVGLRWERARLYERINQRVDRMVADGLEDEVRALLAAGVSRNAPAMKGIGYKEIAAFLTGETGREEALDEIRKATRHFAKRQFTWYRKMPYIHWYDADQLSSDLLCEKVFGDMAGFLQ